MGKGAGTGKRKSGKRKPEDGASNSLLAADDTRPADAGDLPNSEYEVQVVSSLVEHNVFRHGEATRKSVLEALPDCNVANFFRHGHVTSRNPWKAVY